MILIKSLRNGFLVTETLFERRKEVIFVSDSEGNETEVSVDEMVTDLKGEDREYV